MGVMNVDASGLNVRVVPNGPSGHSLSERNACYPDRATGPWLLVAAGCDLTPTFAWSWTAGAQSLPSVLSIGLVD
jgi:hypothetical protein